MPFLVSLSLSIWAVVFRVISTSHIVDIDFEFDSILVSDDYFIYAIGSGMLCVLIVRRCRFCFFVWTKVEGLELFIGL